MPATCSFDYAVVRIVPRVEREEFVNAGVIVFCRERDYLRAHVELDRERGAGALAGGGPRGHRGAPRGHPAHLRGRGGRGPIGKLSRPERFHWLVAPRSTVIQLSPVHAGLCDDPDRAFEALVERVVRRPGRPEPAPVRRER